MAQFNRFKTAGYFKKYSRFPDSTKFASKPRLWQANKTKIKSMYDNITIKTVTYSTKILIGYKKQM